MSNFLMFSIAAVNWSIVVDCCESIYLLCKLYQGTRKTMQKTQKREEKTYKKTPHMVHI